MDDEQSPFHCWMMNTLESISELCHLLLPIQAAEEMMMKEEQTMHPIHEPYVPSLSKLSQIFVVKNPTLIGWHQHLFFLPCYDQIHFFSRVSSETTIGLIYHPM